MLEANKDWIFVSPNIGFTAIAAHEGSDWFTEEQVKAMGFREELESAVNGIKVLEPPRIVFSPSFAPTLDVARTRFASPSRVSITSRSTLVLDGAGIRVKRLSLDGALVVRACEGAFVELTSVDEEPQALLSRALAMNPKLESAWLFRARVADQLGHLDAEVVPGHAAADRIE